MFPSVRLRAVSFLTGGLEKSPFSASARTVAARWGRRNTKPFDGRQPTTSRDRVGRRSTNAPRLRRTPSPRQVPSLTLVNAG